ncbi:MAG: hypothetical protein ACOCQQ_01225 [Candidatus Nanoarchaeia archaeon]
MKQTIKNSIKKTAITSLSAIVLALSPLQEAKAQKHEPRPRFQLTQTLNYQGKQPKTSQYSVGLLVSTEQKKRGLRNGGTAYFSIEAMIPNKNHKITGYEVQGEQLTNPAVFRKYFGSLGWFYETTTVNRNKDLDISMFMGIQQTFGKQYSQGLPEEMSKRVNSWTGYTKIHAGLMFRSNKWDIGASIGPIMSSSFPETVHPHSVTGLDIKNPEGTFEGVQTTLIIRPHYNISKLFNKEPSQSQGRPMF